MNDQIELILYDILEQEMQNVVDLAVTQDTLETCEAILIAGENCVLSGVDIVKRLFEIVDDTLFIKVINPDSTHVEKGDMIMIISGRLSSIQSVKPIGLSIISRMSGIATTTREYQHILQEHNIPLLDSESYTPLFHPFEQVAIQHGGGRLFHQVYSTANIIRSRQTDNPDDDASSIDQSSQNILELDSIMTMQQIKLEKYDIISLHDMSFADTLYYLKQYPSIPTLLHGRYSMEELHEVMQYPLVGIRLKQLTEQTNAKLIQLVINR